MKSSANVVFCDNHLLIAEKPAGLLTQADTTHEPDLESEMRQWVKDSFHKPGAAFLHAIHRLDKPVGGLVLFARTSKGLSRLNELARNGKIRRFYVAEVEGSLPAEEGVLQHELLHGDHRAIVLPSTGNQGKTSILRYWTIQRAAGTTLVRIELQTGRYHQIRAQFAAIGHPIVGDSRYGACEDKATAHERQRETIRLHCVLIEFPHPVTKETVRAESSPFWRKKSF